MASITVHRLNGTKEEFPETSRAGGSWCTHYEVIGEMVVIRDAYGKETLIPVNQIDKVIANPRHY